MYCKKCGRQLEDDSLFCPSCGSAVESGGKIPKTTPVASPKEKLLTAELWISMLIGIAVSGLIFLIWYENIRNYVIFQSLEQLNRSSIGLLSGVLIASIALTIWDWKKGEFRNINKIYLLRGIVGTSLGCMIANIELISTLGTAYNTENALNYLSGEAIISIVIFVAVAVFCGIKHLTMNMAPIILLFYISSIYNVALYIHGFLFPDNATNGMIIMSLPCVVAVIAGICFFRWRGGEV